MRATGIALAAAAAVAAAVCAPLVLAPSAVAARSADDFNGDGYRDLVMLGGSHGKDGRVTVVHGTSTGPGTRVQTLHHLPKGSASGITGTGSKTYGVTSLKLPYDRLGGPFAQ